MSPRAFRSDIVKEKLRCFTMNVKTIYFVVSASSRVSPSPLFLKTSSISFLIYRRIPGFHGCAAKRQSNGWFGILDGIWMSKQDAVDHHPTDKHATTAHVPGHRLTAPSILHQLLGVPSRRNTGAFSSSSVFVLPCKTCQHRVSGPARTVTGISSTTSIETRAD